VSEEREYLLGTDEAELRRLGFQHQVWVAEAATGWDRAGFGPGQHLLDVGCGPGYATLDLARLVGPGGRVTGVDVSARFVAHLHAEIASHGLAHVSAEVQDVERLDLPAEHFDGAFARWVLCFVSRPAEVVAGVARALRPGAMWVIQDYSRYMGLHYAPRSPAFEKAFDAVHRWWKDGGGDPDVGTVLPSLLLAGGFEVAEIRPIVRIARPGSGLWQWPRPFFDHFLRVLVEGGYLTDDDRGAFEAQWEDRNRDPAAYFCTPPMVEILAVRR
jgi:ubiquinone/menaquinone biosynthesis C-methylase UbiE